MSNKKFNWNDFKKCTCTSKITIHHIATCPEHGGAWSYKCGACWEHVKLHEKPEWLKQIENNFQKTFKIIGTCHGQYGDLFLQLPFVEYLRKLYPNSYYIANVNKKYQQVIPILKHCPYIDSFYISDEYENFPGVKDKIYLKSQKFDLVLPAMPKHKNDRWFEKFHQTKEIFDMFGYKSSKEKYQINIPIKPKQKEKRLITFAPFAGYYNQNNNKKLSTEKAQEIVNGLISEGYKVLQIGGWDEPKLVGTFQINSSYSESFQNVIESELFLGTDTGLMWAASGVKQKCLGLYSNQDYGKYIKNIQPVNPNGCYLNARNVNEIPTELILDTVISNIC